MKRWPVLAATFLVTLVAAAPGSAYHYRGLHWQRDLWIGGEEVRPIIKEFGNPGQWEDELFVNVIQNFNPHFRIESYIEWYDYSPSQCPVDQNMQPANGPNAHYVIDVCHAVYGWPQYGEGSGWCGYWSPWDIAGEPSHSHSGDIYLNDFYHPSACNQTYRGLVCHELGHAYGLAHIVGGDGAGSCMQLNGFAGGGGEWLNGHDHDTLSAIYNCWETDGSCGHPAVSPCPPSLCPPGGTLRAVSEVEAVKNPTFKEYMNLRKLEQDPNVVVWWRVPFEDYNEASRQKLAKLLRSEAEEQAEYDRHKG